MNNDARFAALRAKVGGVREPMGYEMTFGQPKEAAWHITAPNKHIRRILSEVEFALKLDEYSERKFTGEISAALYQESELSLLARLVSGEARGEPYIGQVAVAAVVLNRVKSDHFPDTISGVIFQPGAFDAVWDGQFDMTPTDSCIRAARDALNGWDPTGGCVYYYNPSTATNEWIWTRQVQLTIGQHAFAI